MALEPQDLTPRAWEADLIDWRGFRIQQMQDWKRRLKVVDRLYQGRWAELFPNESIMTDNPLVMNLVQQGMDDHARLVTEAQPSVVYPPTSERATAKQDAHLRESVASTHWDVNNGDMMVPQLSLDLSGAGVFFIAAYTDEDEEYPCYQRLNPRFCYPDTLNGKLLDLMVLEDMNIRTAARLFPDLGLQIDPKKRGQVAEIMHYYSPEGCIQAVVVKGGVGGKPQSMTVTKRWQAVDKEGKPFLPVVMGKVDTYDGAFRGFYDQVIGSLLIKNRIVKQTIDYADQLVYAPWEEAGIMNPDAFTNVGPNTVFHRDPNVQGGGAIRVPPPGTAPQLLQFLQYLDQEQRGGTSNPAARQGEVEQDRASASFVVSTQGALTSDVRNQQRVIAKAREELNVISFKLDEAELNFKKELLYPIGNKNSYTPVTDIAGSYRNKVIYGAGAGLDRQSADIRVEGHVAAGLVSKQTGRTQIEYIRTPDAEETQIELEQSVSILQQKLAATEDPTILMKIIALQKEGITFADAVAAVVEQQEHQPGEETLGAPGETPGPEPTPEGPAAQQAGAAAGGTMPGQPLEFAPPPSENISVTNPSPARPINVTGG